MLSRRSCCCCACGYRCPACGNICLVDGSCYDPGGNAWGPFGHYPYVPESFGSGIGTAAVLWATGQSVNNACGPGDGYARGSLVYRANADGTVTLALAAWLKHCPGIGWAYSATGDLVIVQSSTVVPDQCWPTVDSTHPFGARLDPPYDALNTPIGGTTLTASFKRELPGAKVCCLLPRYPQFDSRPVYLDCWPPRGPIHATIVLPSDLVVGGTTILVAGTYAYSLEYFPSDAGASWQCVVQPDWIPDGMSVTSSLACSGGGGVTFYLALGNASASAGWQYPVAPSLVVATLVNAPWHLHFATPDGAAHPVGIYLDA